MVKVNTATFAIPAVGTGKVRNYSNPRFQEDANFSTDTAFFGRAVSPPGHPGANEFNANPPQISPGRQARSRSGFIPPEVNDERYFIVESYFDSRVWVERKATLMAVGNHGNIWVMENNNIPISEKEAQDLADLFDLIYPLSTNILGYEYGGGPDGDGGVDGDPRIQILIYDIVDVTGKVVSAGYFWGKDHYPNNNPNLPSNEAEIFYIDSKHVNEHLDFLPFLLIHEFQHMIHFNNKIIRNFRAPAAWYNEMLSLMAEEIISSAIKDITLDTPNHPFGLMSLFLGTYPQVGMTEWNTLGETSYAKAYAFGAYLLRNFGGAELLKEMMANNETNVTSISMALDRLNPGMDFDEALFRFAEAMIYSGDSVAKDILTFDRSVSSEINGINYTAEAFDVWDITSYDPSREPIRRGQGPFIFSLTPVNMRPNSIIIQSNYAWLNVSGSINIVVEEPLDPNVKIYFLVR